MNSEENSAAIERFQRQRSVDNEQALFAHGPPHYLLCDADGFKVVISSPQGALDPPLWRYSFDIIDHSDGDPIALRQSCIIRLLL